MDNYDSYDTSRPDTRDDQTSQSRDRTIAALFASEDDAKNAKDALKDAGFDHVDLTKKTDADDAAEARQTHEHGFWDSVKDFFGGNDDAHVYGEGVRRGHSLVTVHTEQARAGEAVEILDRYNPIDIDRSEQEWRNDGWSAERSKENERASYLDARADSGRAADDRREEVIPVAEERLAVGKRDVEGGNVRVRSYVREVPVNQQVDLRQENVSIERRPVDRELGDAEGDAFRDRTVEMTEHNEEPVVAKNARVTEEVVVRKDVGSRTENVNDTVRKTEVEVDGDRARSYDPAHH